MSTLLTFQYKPNKRKAPRVYVRSVAKNRIYGSFAADAPELFDGWDQIEPQEVVELKLYIDNLIAVRDKLGSQYLPYISDYRFKIPEQLINAIDEIGILCKSSSISLDFYAPMLETLEKVLQEAIQKLSSADKIKAELALKAAGVEPTQEKSNASERQQVIFSQLGDIFNKVEKLHLLAQELFDKDKSVSPRTIHSYASGEKKPASWMTCCAIALLLQEQPDTTKSLLSENDFLYLLAKPLLKADKASLLSQFIDQYNLEFIKPHLI